MGLQRALRVEELGVLEGGGGGTRNEVKKRLKVAVDAKGKVLKFVGLKLCADVGTISL